MSRFEKRAYGGSFSGENGEPGVQWDRWMDMGYPSGLSQARAAALTKVLADSAAKANAKLTFQSERYFGDHYSPEEAINRILSPQDRPDYYDTLPNYYFLETPQKPRSGILEHLRLKSPKHAPDWPDATNHPMSHVGSAYKEFEKMDQENKAKSPELEKAASFGARMGKAAAEAWQTSEGKNPEGGLNEKGRASLRAQGHDIKRPQPEGGARKDSFCARMKGMKSKLTSSETANDPDSRINKSLRKWKC